MSIALVSLIAVGSPAMADHIRGGNSAAGKGSHNGNHKPPEVGMTDPNCRGVRASLFVIDHGGLGLLVGKRHGEDLTHFIAIFFGYGADDPDCIFSVPLP